VKRHAVTPYGREAGSSRVRVFSWLDRIDTHIDVHSYLSRRNADPRELLRRPDLVVRVERELRRLAADRTDWLMLHREASPLSRGGLERDLLAHTDVAIYDFDDALQWDAGEGATWRRLAPKSAKALAAVRTADRVVAGNDVLADWASDHARDVVVVPSCVAVGDYRPKPDYGLSDPPRLVWIGSRDNEEVLTTIGPVLEEVHSRFGARLTLIGSAQPTLGTLERLVDRVPWSPGAQHAVLATADLGLMPLRDDPYSRGKCGYKLLQYAAAGLPAVASPVGANSTILTALGQPAAGGRQEWVDALTAILEGSDTDRALLGRRARDAAASHYSYEAWKARWESAVGLTTDGTPGGAS